MTRNKQRHKGMQDDGETRHRGEECSISQQKTEVKRQKKNEAQDGRHRGHDMGRLLRAVKEHLQ